MVMTRAHIHISGRVQGVFFRAHTEEEARRLGLTGWVRNTRDAKVEAVFEGEKDKVEEVLWWCRNKGSPSSKVDDIEVEWGDYTGEFDGFGVRF